MVTVRGVNDFVVDGNTSFSIVTSAATSTDSEYSGMNPSDVAVTNVDNEIRQVYVKSHAGLVVAESGTQATFQVRLTIAPTKPVTCTLQTSDPTDGSVSPTSLSFEPNHFGL